jgi:hypothetical protein
MNILESHAGRATSKVRSDNIVVAVMTSVVLSVFPAPTNRW